MIEQEAIKIIIVIYPLNLHNNSSVFAFGKHVVFKVYVRNFLLKTLLCFYRICFKVHPEQVFN